MLSWLLGDVSKEYAEELFDRVREVDPFAHLSTDYAIHYIMTEAEDIIRESEEATG